MTRVIYADSLLVVNFSMDFLALYITLKLQNGVVRPLRMSLAASIGAVWALVSVLLEPYTANIFLQMIMLAAHIVCAAVISSVAAGARRVSLGRTLTFVAVNVGLGGIMTALYAFIGKTAWSVTRDGDAASADSSAVVFILAAFVAGAVSLAYGRFKAHSLGRKRVRVTLAAFGKESEIDVLCDSGNLLRDPFSGKPVVVLCAERMKSVLPSELICAAESTEQIAHLPSQMAERVRLIPASTVTGRGMMLCFVPDRIEVEGNIVDAVAALDTHSENYEGCDGIVGQILLNV